MSSDGPNPKKRSRADDDEDSDEDDEKTAQTSKCKGATTIPIFLKKTYKMIDTCDQTVAAWTPDGEMFVVKDPDLFATTVIPQYFDHNKFSSFARQLNFYGFRKMQSKPIRNSDFDSNTAKHVTFFNENFKRGRCDLLKKIQRSTRGGGNNSAQDHQREVQNLKEQVTSLENKMADMTQQFEERMRRLELDMLGRMEQMMLAMAQQQQTQLQLQQTSSAGGSSNGPGSTVPGAAHLPGRGASAGEAWEPLPFGARGTSINSIASANPGMFAAAAAASGQSASAAASGASADNASDSAKASGAGPGPTLPPHPKQKPLPPTLPPHPKQKSLSPTGLPGAVTLPPSRFGSLARGLSRGISNLSRGISAESSTSAALLRNSWEDKFFSMLMLEGDTAAAVAQNMAAMGQGAGGAGMAGLSPNEMQQLLNARALSIGGPQMSRFSELGGHPQMSRLTSGGGPQMSRLASELGSQGTTGI